MARSPLRLKAVAVVSVAGLVLAACGSNTESKTSDTPAPTSASAAAPASPSSEPASASSDAPSSDSSAPASESSGSAETSGSVETSGSGSATDAPTSSGAAAPADCSGAKLDMGGVLKIGTILPQTGSLAFLGPPEIAGVNLAIEEMQSCLGKDKVTVTHKDSSDDSTPIAKQSADALIQAQVSAIVGAAASGVTKLIINQITGAGILQISPANTSPDFTTWDDKGLYWRTAPSDLLQGEVLGNLILEDGHTNVALIALDDAYGTGLIKQTSKTVKAGGGNVVLEKIYDPKASSFSSEISAIAAAKPDALVIIGFDETIKIINGLKDQGIGPAKLPTYFVDGNLKNYGDKFAKGTLTGAKGTLPGGELSQEFKDKLLKVDPKLEDFSYGAESYDATILVGLAALAAKSTKGADIAKQMMAVSTGGEKCTTFAQCATMLAEGKDIDYDGASGPVEFNDVGDPTKATIGIYQYGEDNNNKAIDYR